MKLNVKKVQLANYIRQSAARCNKHFVLSKSRRFVFYCVYTMLAEIESDVYI